MDQPWRRLRLRLAAEGTRLASAMDQEGTLMIVRITIEPPSRSLSQLLADLKWATRIQAAGGDRY